VPGGVRQLTADEQLDALIAQTKAAQAARQAQQAQPKALPAPPVPQVQYGGSSSSSAPPPPKVPFGGRPLNQVPPKPKPKASSLNAPGYTPIEELNWHEANALYLLHMAIRRGERVNADRKAMHDFYASKGYTFPRPPGRKPPG
jgi:hypothetical protein